MARPPRLTELLPGDARGGALLVLCAAVALFWANSGSGGTYFALLAREIVGGLDVLHLVNDLGMAVFFLVVGMEIRREFAGGELADRKRAALPIAGALGGMVVPALIYTAFNAGGPGAHGWGIPMATDIAFSLGVLALLGPRVPRGLTVFLAALAIADDLGAVLVIALFYTRALDLPALLGAFALVAGLAFLGRRTRRTWPWLVAAPVLWTAMHASGVHATIAGVLLGWTLPHDALAPVERRLRPWVTWGILPVFALANAGVRLEGASLAAPVALGVSLGLFVGKPVGIVATSALLVRLGWASLPRGATWRELVGVGMIAGIGFTVALFVAALSFPGDGALEPVAKTGILAASAASAILGVIVLSTAPREERS